MKAENHEQENTMTIKGTTQLSMNVSPELKTRIKLTAIKEGKTMTNLILEWIEDGLSKSEKKE